ncbi:MAG: hypothetical protein HYY86_02575 [Candidatus Harrisonbacteria bacterium]|nr:hypothetical protein [Candidatus Harrisonbacteria bacterium]
MEGNFEKNIKRELIQEQIDAVLKTISEFSGLKKEAADLKEKGEKYDPHFDSIDPAVIQVKEAELWQKMKIIDSKEKYNDFVQELRAYRNALQKELREAGQERDTNPHAAFAAYLSNKTMGVYEKLEE